MKTSIHAFARLFLAAFLAATALASITGVQRVSAPGGPQKQLSSIPRFAALDPQAQQPPQAEHVADQTRLVLGALQALQQPSNHHVTAGAEVPVPGKFSALLANLHFKENGNRFKAAGDNALNIISTSNLTSQVNSTINNLEDTAAGRIQLTPVTGVVAGVLILLGLALVFAGNQVFKPILFASGFITFFLLGLTVVTAIDASREPKLEVWVYFLVCGIAGILGGFLFTALWKFGLFFIGAALGFCLAALIAIALQNVWTNTTTKYIFFGIMAIIGGIAILFREKELLVLATSFIGSYTVFIGLDVFVRVGFASGAIGLAKGNVADFVKNNNWIYMLIGCVVLALLGIAVQFRNIRAHGGHRGLNQRDANYGNVSNKSAGRNGPISMPSNSDYRKL
ncbi:hypothetical protein BJ741DRAFT_591734 [Chytriomyces cf. hyalinus JEL632]|nr:hypothetical protein BJ741DRAFT_591734 [Chytriomyces cf. hyalinus JEL632]